MRQALEPILPKNLNNVGTRLACPYQPAVHRQAVLISQQLVATQVNR
jgi:hypothetical protein